MTNQMARQSARLKVASLIVPLLLISVPLHAKRKDDVVIMKNGDKFTGEIKAMEYGELIFSADYMKDPVHLDWKRVEALQSQDTFIVSFEDGTRVTGLISKLTSLANEGKNFTIAADEKSVETASSSVITISQREGSFWNQLTGSVSYGLSFAGGNNSSNSSLAADVGYRTARNAVQLATTSQFDSQQNATNTNRFTFDAQYDRYFTRNWFAAGLFSVLKSNQQDLNLRTTYGGAIGRLLLQTDRSSLAAIGGLAYSHENYSPQSGIEPVRDNVESLLGLTFSTFRFSKLNLRSQTLLFPSLSDPGRVRLSSQSGLRIELVRNFYWSFQLYENYDSRPPIKANKNDLGITTSVGWSF